MSKKNCPNRFMCEKNRDGYPDTHPERAKIDAVLAKCNPSTCKQLDPKYQAHLQELADKKAKAKARGRK